MSKFRGSTANIMAAFGIIAGVVSVFYGIESNDMLILITGAGVGYLFKNGISRGKIPQGNNPPDPVSTQ